MSSGKVSQAACIFCWAGLGVEQCLHRVAGPLIHLCYLPFSFVCPGFCPKSGDPKISSHHGGAGLGRDRSVVRTVCPRSGFGLGMETPASGLKRGDIQPPLPQQTLAAPGTAEKYQKKKEGRKSDVRNLESHICCYPNKPHSTSRRRVTKKKRRLCR